MCTRWVWVIILSVPSLSGWCVKPQQDEAEDARTIAFQFPLYRDGV